MTRVEYENNMMSWKLIIDIGHTAVMLPLAGAIAAWLIVGGAWKMALSWCILFAGGLSLVALSKIAYLGWEVGIPALEFKALSGHAFRATAVIPVLFFVVLEGNSVSSRRAGGTLGISISAILGVLVVHFGFHSTSEVIASFMLGIVVSLVYMHIAAILPAPRVKVWTIPVCMIVFIICFSLKPSSVTYRLVDVALYLSGNDRPYAWSKKMRCRAQEPVSR